MAKYCKTCGIPLQDTAKFCPRCGAPAQEEICAQCGAELPPGGKFCAGCGAPHQAPSPRAPSLPPEPTVDAKSPPPYSQPASPQKCAKRQTAGIIAIIASGLALVLLFVFVIGPNIPRWTGGGGQAGTHTSQTPVAPVETPGITVATYKDPEPEAVIYSEAYGLIPVNQLIVVFEDGVDKAAAKKTLREIGGTMVGEMEIINLYQLETDFTTEAELTAAMDAARALVGVELVFPNTALYLDEAVEATACSPLRDPLYEDEDNAAHYKLIGMENAWSMSTAFGQLIRHLEMPHIRFHDLRHTAATNMHQLTGDFYTVGEILGHTLKGIGISLASPPTLKR